MYASLHSFESHTHVSALPLWQGDKQKFGNGTMHSWGSAGVPRVTDLPRHPGLGGPGRGRDPRPPAAGGLGPVGGLHPGDGTGGSQTLVGEEGGRKT